MFAVLKTGGKQYKVQAGDVLRVEKLAADAGEKIQFNDVLMLADQALHFEDVALGHRARDALAAVDLAKEEQHVAAGRDRLHDAVEVDFGVEGRLRAQVPGFEARHETRHEAHFSAAAALARGAGARANLENTVFRVEGVAIFACQPFARGAKQRRNFTGKPTKNDPKIHQTIECRNARETPSQIIKHEPKCLPKSTPEGRKVNPQKKVRI